MSRFMNRDEFKKYVLRKLGGGINRIVPSQMSFDQLDDAVEDSIRLFNREHIDGSRKRTMVIQKDTHGQTLYILPKTVIAVNDILFGRYTYYNSSSSGSSGQMENYLLFGRRSGSLSTRTRDGQVTTPYYIQEMAYNTFADVLLAKPQFTFSFITRELIVQSPIDRRNFFAETNAIYLDIMEANSEDSNPEIYDHEWLRDYTVALAGIQWAQNLTRYTNVALVGQAQSNGEAMLARYEAKKEKLEVELKASGMPPRIFVL